jgi:hypothetical protein
MDFEGYLYKIGRQKSTIKKHTNPEYVLKDIKQYIDSYELDNDKRFEYVVTQTEKALQVRINLKYRAS